MTIPLSTSADVFNATKTFGTPVLNTGNGGFDTVSCWSSIKDNKAIKESATQCMQAGGGALSLAGSSVEAKFVLAGASVSSPMLKGLGPVGDFVSLAGLIGNKAATGDAWSTKDYVQLAGGVAGVIGGIIEVVALVGGAAAVGTATASAGVVLGAISFVMGATALVMSTYEAYEKTTPEYQAAQELQKQIDAIGAQFALLPVETRAAALLALSKQPAEDGTYTLTTAAEQAAFGQTLLKTISAQQLAELAMSSLDYQKVLLTGGPLPIYYTPITSPVFPAGYVERDSQFWLDRAQLYLTYSHTAHDSPFFGIEVPDSAAERYIEAHFGTEEYGVIYHHGGIVNELSPASTFDQVVFSSGISIGTATGGSHNDTLYGQDGIDVLVGGGGQDMLKGYGGNDDLSGGDGQDQLLGGAGDDVLDGGAGSDVLRGGAGDDWLGFTARSDSAVSTAERDSEGNQYWGGSGNDRLAGSKGDDTYYFRRGDGYDEIRTEGGADTLMLGQYDDPESPALFAEIAAGDVKFVRDGKDLKVVINSAQQLNDVVAIKDWFQADTPGNQLQQVVLGDKTWTTAEINQIALTQHGTENSDVLAGVAGFKNWLYGDGGKDELRSAQHNATTGLGDTYNGGGGDDQIFGSNASDTYEYSAADGNDVLLESGGSDDTLKLTGISYSAATIWQTGNDLVIDFGTGQDSVTITDWYLADSYTLESVQFDDVTLRKQELQHQAGFGVIGTAGTDYLGAPWPFDGNKLVLYGRGGDDNIYTADVSTTVLFGKGDGNDTLYLSSGPVVVKLGADMGSIASVKAAGNGLAVVTFTTGESISAYSLDTPGTAFTLRYANGVTYSGVNLIDLIQNHGTSGDDALYANSSSPNLVGFGGNDNLWGNAANNELNGGTGNDVLYGNGGSDRYMGEGGDDTIFAGTPNTGSSFVFSRDAGHDTVYLYNTQENKVDTLRIVRGENFTVSPTQSDLLFTKTNVWSGGFDAVVSFRDTGESITISGFGYGREYAIDQILFDDGSIMAYAEIVQKLEESYDPTTIVGTERGDYLYGNGTATRLFGMGGADTLVSDYKIAEKLYGGAGADSIYGGEGDVLAGGADNDVLYGSTGVETFNWAVGDGLDTLYAGIGDTVSFTDLTGVSSLLASRDGADLKVSSGSGSGLVLKNWFAGETPNLQLTDGTIWSASQVNGMFKDATYEINFPFGISSGSNFAAVVTNQSWEFQKFAGYMTWTWETGLQYGSYTGTSVDGYAVREWGFSGGTFDEKYAVGQSQYGVWAEMRYQFWQTATGDYAFSLTNRSAGSGNYTFNYRDTDGDGWTDTYDTMPKAYRIYDAWTPSTYEVSPAVNSFNLLDASTQLANKQAGSMSYDGVTAFNYADAMFMGYTDSESSGYASYPSYTGLSVIETPEGIVHVELIGQGPSLAI